MAYHIELDGATVTPYLDSLDLSPKGRQALDRVIGHLAAYGDQIANEPSLRLSPGSAMFEVHWVFRDPTTKVFHNLRLIVSDAAAAFGVLRILFAEDETPGSTSPFP